MSRLHGNKLIVYKNTTVQTPNMIPRSGGPNQVQVHLRLQEQNKDTYRLCFGRSKNCWKAKLIFYKPTKNGAIWIKFGHGQGPGTTTPFLAPLMPSLRWLPPTDVPKAVPRWMAKFNEPKGRFEVNLCNLWGDIP